MTSTDDLRDCLLVAIGRGSPGTARDLLEQFEAAVRADQRQRDVQEAVAERDRHLPRVEGLCGMRTTHDHHSWIDLDYGQLRICDGKVKWS